MLPASNVVVGASVQDDSVIPPLEAVLSLEAWRSDRSSRKSTGFAVIDELTGGFDAGQVWIVTGTPGQGRSTLATQWALRTASVHDLTTHLISTREPARLVGARLLSCAGRVSALRVWNHELTDSDQPGIDQAHELLGAAPLLIAGPSDLSLLDADLDDGEWPQAVVVDDADVAAGAFPKRIQSFSARGILVILTLPRHVVLTPTGLNPLWSRAADFVIDIRRPDVLDHRSFRPGEADLHVLRNRWGPTRRATVAFQGHYARFVEISR